MLKRHIRDGIVIGLSVIVVVTVAIFYSVFASQHIFDESKEHLNEIYDQINNAFISKVDANQNLLRSLEQYIDNSVDDMNSTDPDTVKNRRDEFANFMHAQIGLWGYTNFYFINRTNETVDDDNDYRHVVKCKPLGFKESTSASDPSKKIYELDDYEPVDLRFRRSLKELIEADKAGVVGRSKEVAVEDDNFVMFAVDVENKSYGGFDYDSIGISFSSDDMLNLLSSKIFGTAGVCYVILPDGNILMQTGGGSATSNYLEFLKGCDIDGSTTGAIGEDWKNGKRNTCLINNGSTEYYLTYTPIGFADWILVGAVPSESVNSSMNWFRTVTIIVMVSIFAFVAVIVICMLVLNTKRRMKEATLEIKSRENLLDLLSLNSSDIFVTFDTDTLKAEYVSSNMENVLGIETEAVRADVRKILDAAVEDYKPFTSKRLKELPIGNAGETDVHMRNVKSGEEYWFHMALYHSNDDGKDKCVLMFSDRTEEVKMRGNLEEALTLAKNANAAKSNFLSNMSHDIRTPMNAIIGYATLLAKDAENPERVREYTHKISYSGQHLLSLINDVLDMSKIESGKTSLYIEQFSLPEFIEELYSMISAQTNAKKQTFDVHTKGHIPEFVMGDKMRLNQIMLNILSNAVKYTPSGGTVSLRVETMKQQVHKHVHLMFTVEDNGIGMSKEFIDTIFDPFSRETTKDTKSIQGTGLGMAITKNIVDLMGGVITVESELGKGSTFAVELELALGNEVPDDEDFWKHHNVTHVLVVDDEEDVCMDIKELMADTGVDVDYALNGQDAVKAVEKAVKTKEDYNIVLLDWKMPGMDGLETARRIRAKVGRDLPIMVLTSYSFEDIEEEAKEAGIDLFLSKPFFVSNFRRAVMQISADGVAADITPEDDDASIDGLHILAAEDNEINVEILTELLDIEGATCDIAYNGQEAVEKFEASKPGHYDVIFMDIQMPVMNGYDAAKAIRESAHKDAKKIPIIAMTANAFDDDVKAALQSGMNAHLAKPIDMKKLKQLVSKLLQK